MSKVKVQQALTRRLKLKQPRFRLERWGDRVNGHVISETFKRMDDLRRQRSIWSALEAEFGPSAMRQVGMILAYTPEEWDFDAPQPARVIRPARKALRPARRGTNGSAKAHLRA